MDDVWDRSPPLEFDEIGIPKRDNYKGSKVLITTRSKRIFDQMGCDKMIELELLSEEEAWTMFKMYAGISNSSSNNLNTTGCKIAEECKQLPAAIEFIASRLKGQQHQVWDATLKSLKHVAMDNVDEEKVIAYKCLKFIYDHMKDEKAKELFHLSSLFPKDKEIPMEILTRLSIGTGLFGKDYHSYNDARNQVVVIKNKLIDSCLLVKVDEEHVKMHDLVREAAQWMEYKAIRHVNLSNKDEKSSVEKEKNMKYLFCKGKEMDLFSWKYDSSKLETLILDVERDEDRKCMEAPNSFFENIDQLQVLYFLGHDKRPLSLSHSIHSLSNIRSILVDRVDLGDISVLGNLQTLETLDLVGCKISKLPHEIAKLKKFKLLKLEECEIRRNNPFEVIKSCSRLEELYFVDSFNESCREIILPELKRYHIQKGWSEIDDSLSKYVSFDAYDDDECFFSKETFKYCMVTAEALQLNSIKEGWRNLMPQIVPIDLGMKDLVELRLRCISQLQCLVDTSGSPSPNVLSKLVVLDLVEMENLEELFHGSLSFDSLKYLEKVSINGCKKLRILFNCKLNLCNLKTLRLLDCPLLVNLFTLKNTGIYDNGDDENGGNNWSNVFPKLKTLSVQNCMQLEYIFGHYTDDHPSQNEIHLHLPVLQCVNLCNLPRLVSISPKQYQTPFPKLEELKLTDCSLDNTIMNFLYKWKRAECLPLPSNIMCNIKEITLSGISKIKSVFMLSFTPIMSVETLRIENCDELKHIIVDTEDDESGDNNWIDVFPKLKTLFVQNCKKLKYIFEHYTDDHPPHNEIFLHLPALQCLKLCVLPSLVAMSPKPYHTTFSPLKELELMNCSLDNRIMKDVEEGIALKNSQTKAASAHLELAGGSSQGSVLEKQQPTSQQGLINQQHPLGEIDTTIKPFQGDEEGTALTNVKIITTLTHLGSDSSSQVREEDVDVRDSLETTKFNDDQDFQTSENFESPFQQLEGETKGHDNSNENPSAETTNDMAVGVGIEVEAALGHKLTSSQKLEAEKSTSQQDSINQQDHPIGEIDNTIKPSQCLKETNDQSLKVDYMSEKTGATTKNSISKIRNESPIQLVSRKLKGVEEWAALRNANTKTTSTNSELVGSSQMSDDEKGSALTNAKTTAPSTHLELVNPLQEQDIGVRDSVETTKINDGQVPLNEDALVKVSSIIEEQFHKGDEFSVLKSKPFPSNRAPLPLAFKTPSLPSKEDHCQIVEDLSSPGFVTRELEQLVPKKHLDYENLSLLTDFLVKHPSVLLRDTSLGNTYKGYAYNCLTKLLKFLETHSLLDVLGSSYSEYVELLKDVRSFAFDKGWLDGVEKRILFSYLQFSQDALQKLFDSNKQVTEDVEVVSLKINNLTQHVKDLKHQLTSSKAILESLTEQERSILESKVDLSAPIGY